MTAHRALPATNSRTAGLSPLARRWLAEASAALDRMQPDAAERSLTSVLALAPDSSEALRLMGIAAQMRGEHHSAVDFLRSAMRNCPDDAMLHMNLGSALYEAGLIDDALSHLRCACELAPNMAACWYNLGKALKLQFEYDDACSAFQRALKFDSTHTLSRIGLADAHTGLGNIAEAAREYREVLRRQPEQPQAWFSLTNLKTEKLTSGDVARLQQAFRRPSVSSDARILLGFGLAKALEDQGNYAAAFDVLQQANALKRRTVRWSADAEHARVDAIMQAFARPLPVPEDVTLGHEVIFIVSLPRSGSTLTEQILASHPEVEGANEITDLPRLIEEESKRRGKLFPDWVNDATALDWSRLGHQYLARTQRWRRERPRFTDKNLVTWQLVGAIMAMLPGARVVNCRRDPLETCFACYHQLFSNGAHFSYDLSDMAAHYGDYARLSRYWQERFPQRIFDHSHDALLEHPEARIRSLLDFCGLAFHPGCLTPHLSTRTVRSTASAAQVRQPLHAGTSRSACYREQLKLLQGQLREGGLL